MRRPHVKFTVRRMMVVVAVTGVILGVYVMSIKMIRLSDTYRGLVDKHKILESIYQVEVKNFRSIWWRTEIVRLGTEYAEARVKYHGEMMRKYDYASRYPWLSVEPDPPPPE